MHPEISLAQRIRRYRRTLGETQEEFGARFGVKRLAVGNWERGTSTPSGPHVSLLNQLFEAVAKSAAPEGMTHQLSLPFAPPVELALKISPHTADTIHFEIQINRKVG
jgi:transcriptional regulator with XRE-family HTH domain